MVKCLSLLILLLLALLVVVSSANKRKKPKCSKLNAKRCRKAKGCQLKKRKCSAKKKNGYSQPPKCSTIKKAPGCRKAKNRCEWKVTSKGSGCYDKCSVLKRGQDCRKAPTCAWVGGKCMDSDCSRLGKLQCDSSPTCTFSLDQQSCYKSCSLVKQGSQCGTSPVCTWAGDECLDSKCSLLGKQKCEKSPICSFDFGLNSCFEACPRFAEKATCEESPVCKWEDVECIGSNHFVCPQPGSSVNVQLRAGVPAMFRSSKAGELCTLVEVDNGSGDVIKPVARSYDANQWEPSAGEYAHVEWFGCDASECKVRLPTAAKYQLTTFVHSISTTDVKARFLEQATFGPTWDSINSFPGAVAWIKDQIENIPASSHRRFFREHANYRSEIPSRMGVVTQPCEANTRYRKYTFTRKDDGRRVDFQKAPSGKYYVMVDGEARTVVGENIQFEKDDEWHSLPIGNGPYLTCRTRDGVGRSFYLDHPTEGCVAIRFGGVYGNPEVYFDSTDTPMSDVVALKQEEVDEINQELYGGRVKELFVKQGLSDSICDSLPTLENRNGDTARRAKVVVGLYQGKYFLHDSRFVLLENTLDKPMQDGGGAQTELTKFEDPAYPGWSNDVFMTACSNVKRTFLNEDSCVLSREPSLCTPVDTPKEDFYIEYWALRRIFQATGGTGSKNEDDGPNTRYLYAVSGLRNERGEVDAPCTPGFRSRWLAMPNMSYCEDDSLLDYPPDSVDATTRDIFAELIGKSADKNKYIRDIVLPTTGVTGCNGNSYNFTVPVGDTCWRNVDPDHLTVYDFTDWAKEHPGGPSPITQFAQWGAPSGRTFRIEFPSWHQMDRWYDNGLKNLTRIGRLGDEIGWADLPPYLSESRAVAAAFEKTATISVGGGAVVCGSPYEVANEPLNYGSKDGTGFDLATDYNSTANKQATTVWMQIALHRSDQLRQRMAWALSQILVISPGSIDTSDQSEHFLTYYDIFVRNAFGNYRDVLREVSYSPVMAEMLTFLRSQSTAYIWSKESNLEYADENFAREIMQLFSIGLFELNDDGTEKLVGGVPQRTYSSFDVAEYARAWTGFDMQKRRGNVEEPSWHENRIDPMQLRVEWRDHLPKMGLNGQYIGDGWPLCADLPSKHFLKTGATFRLLGTRPDPEVHEDLPAWTGEDRLSLTEDSLLYKKLCNKVGDACQFKSKVVLSSNLAACTGSECNVDTLRVVKVGDVFYEYIRPACVHQAFYDNAKLMKRTSDDDESDFHQCGDPRTEVASTACCQTSPDGYSTALDEVFSGERVAFTTASGRCSLCESPDLLDGCQTRKCDESVHFWTTKPCKLQVKIDLQGRVAIVHTAEGVPARNISSMVQQDTKVFFRVNWQGGDANRIADDYDGICDDLGCGRDEFDNQCLCDVTVSESVPFASMPTADQVLSRLHIGAFEPSVQPIEGDSSSPVMVFSPGGTYSKETVFAANDMYGIRRYRKNTESVVVVGNGQLRFRNPVHFISLADPEIRDAQYETEAALDHYFYHQNMGPFLATRLAQRFGISNPSPRFVAAIATAFRQGSYKTGGTSFGTEEYGDLEATIAAVLLDRESRSVVLDADPAHGSLLEPFLKFVRLMRSLEFEGDSDRPFIVFDESPQEQLGQESHEIPSVFSFFKPEFSPSGRIAQSGLVGPEGQILTGPNVMNFFRGTFSLLKYGFEDAYGGFGYDREWGSWKRDIGNYSHSYGHMTAWPRGNAAREIVDELATLLTSGRLSEENRQIIVGAFEDTILAGKTTKEAIINVQQLITTTAEFHTNTLMRKIGDERELPEPSQPSSKPYKAVVHVMLAGGMDSFNMLVPHAGCSKNAAGATVLEQYESERGVLAFTQEERQLIIDAAGSNQPCSKFAIHDELTLLKQLYEEEDLIFLANIGVINQNMMTKANYEDKTTTQLFAHNAMQEEAKRIDPFDKQPGTGVCGRAADLLQGVGYSVNKITIDNPAVSVVGNPGLSPTPLTVSRRGATTFNERPREEEYFDLQKYAFNLNSATDAQKSSVFAETWSNEFASGVHNARNLEEYLSRATLSSVWESEDETNLWLKMNTVARLIKTHDLRGTDRDMFYVEFGSFDHHTNLKVNLREKFAELNKGLELFVSELKAQEVWDNVTIVFTSDFARTITPNSGAGSDHSWGGHTFLMGGSVAGKKILGRYPDDITPDGPLNIGRGSIIPTTSWDAMWNGVAEWMGVNPNQLNHVLPNRNEVVEPGFKLFTKSDLYE